jgi:hypothetical protein
VQALESRRLMAADLVGALGGSIVTDPVGGVPMPGDSPVEMKQATATKIGGLLSGLYLSQQPAGGLSRAESRLVEQAESSKDMFRVMDGQVLIHASSNGNVLQLQNDIQVLGGRVTGSAGNQVSAWVPIAKLSLLAQTPSLGQARPSMARTNVGDTTSQADIAMRVDSARTAYEINGAGVTVGVLSDSYDFDGNPFTSAAQDIATRDLPAAGVQVLDESDTEGIDEGRAMLQLIHDLAPGSPLQFHTAFDGAASFAEGIVDLANAGSDVIVDDIIYLDEPFFQDGPIAQAVNEVVGRGVPYFSSAGNNGRNSWEGQGTDWVVDENADMTNWQFVDFDRGPDTDLYQRFYVPVNSYGIFVLQWDDPFASIDLTSPGADADLDFMVFGDVAQPDMASMINVAWDFNVGADPLEILQFFNDGTFDFDLDGFADEYFQIGIGSFTPETINLPGLVKYVYFTDALQIEEFDTQSGTAYGHANAASALAVGAAYYEDTPQYGQDPPLPEYFSSAGGIPILMQPNGTRYFRPQVRTTPDFTAVDGTNNTFFGDDFEGDGFPNFFGTSAAAPHAAAVAALMMEVVGGPGVATPTQIRTSMTTTAINMLSPGFDNDTGWGLVDAQGAIDHIVGVLGLPKDYGDAPNSYGTSLEVDGARHEKRKPILGEQRDTEKDANLSTNATGDDTKELDDEDGVIFTSAPLFNKPLNQRIFAAEGGVLNAWFDFNRNGVFEPSEHLIEERVLDPGVNELSVLIPATAQEGATFIRYRLTAGAGQGNTPTGLAANGEVEDYVVTVRALPPAPLNDAVVINGSFTNPNRSGISTVQFRYNQPVVVPDKSVLRVINRTTGQLVPMDRVSLTGNGTPYLTWNFAEVPYLSMPNGLYTYELSGDQVSSPEGALVGGILAGSFHRLRGDVNGDRKVNSTDTRLVETSQNNSPGLAYRPADANGDGRVTSADVSFVNAFLNPTGLPVLPLDFGDAPETTATKYPVRLARNGARNVMTETLRLGNTIDAETDGRPNSTATGDGADEDGVTMPRLTIGTTVNLTVAVKAPPETRAHLNAWVDFNRDGDWDDADERIAENLPVFDGNNFVSLVIPSGLAAGNVFGRFRLTTLAGYGYAGFAADGEVEDYAMPLVSPSLPPGGLGFTQAAPGVGSMNVSTGRVVPIASAGSPKAGLSPEGESSRTGSGVSASSLVATGTPSAPSTSSAGESLDAVALDRWFQQLGRRRPTGRS